MPIYDYVCTACGVRHEVMHGVNEAGPGVCPACGGPLRKLLSAPAIVFKGSGWAKMDARASSRSKGGPADADRKAASAKADSAGGEGGSGDGAGKAGGASDAPVAKSKESSAG